MEYTVVITKEPETIWRAIVPALPDCEAEAETRDQVIAEIRERIAEAIRHIEILRVEVPTADIQAQGGNGVSGYRTFEEEWPDFGIFRDDPTLDELFDEVERRRDAQLTGD